MLQLSHIEEESGLSYTQLEYEYALSKEMPIYSIVLTEKYLHSKPSNLDGDKIFEYENKNTYKLFVLWAMQVIRDGKYQI